MANSRSYTDLKSMTREKRDDIWGKVEDFRDDIGSNHIFVHLFGPLLLLRPFKGIWIILLGNHYKWSNGLLCKVSQFGFFSKEA